MEEPFEVQGDVDLADEPDEFPPHPTPDADVTDEAETQAASILSEAMPLVGQDPAKAIELLKKSSGLDPRGTRSFTLLAKANVKVRLRRCLGAVMELAHGCRPAAAQVPKGGNPRGVGGAHPKPRLQGRFQVARQSVRCLLAGCITPLCRTMLTTPRG